MLRKLNPLFGFPISKMDKVKLRNSGYWQFSGAEMFCKVQRSILSFLIMIHRLSHRALNVFQTPDSRLQTVYAID